MPFTLPAVAVIVAEPVALPVTSPFADTEATPALDVDQETLTLRTFPLASRGVAVSCVVCAGDRVMELGLTDTVATTGAATVTVAVPL